MEHAYVAEHDVTFRYVMRKLSDEEARAFEEHLVDCPRCLDDVEEVQSLHRGLHRSAADRLASAGPLPAAATHDRRAPSVRTVMTWLAAAAVVVVSAGTFGYLRLRQQVNAAEQRAGESDRAYQSAREAAARAQGALRDAAASRPAIALPQAIAVLDLDIVRGAEAASKVQAVSVPAQTELVVITLEVGNTSEYSRYRVTLRNERGATVWERDDVRPASAATVAAAVPANLIGAGSFTVLLQGIGSDGRVAGGVQYPFRIAAAR
jgi:hypothetical protein